MTSGGTARVSDFNDQPDGGGHNFPSYSVAKRAPFGSIGLEEGPINDIFITGEYAKFYTFTPQDQAMSERLATIESKVEHIKETLSDDLKPDVKSINNKLLYGSISAFIIAGLMWWNLSADLKSNAKTISDVRVDVANIKASVDILVERSKQQPTEKK